jgi:hypothetical protein
MSTQLTRNDPPEPRGLYPHNWIAFPRELRSAISELHGARLLEIDALSGKSSNTPLFGRFVELNVVVKETGKLRGEFILWMGLQADAARQLAATLTRLADELEPSGAAS